MVKYFFILLSIVVNFNVSALEQVTASVDKNPISINESFILEVIADDKLPSNALDTSPLLQDFIVGNTSVSSQTSMINGKTSKKTKWTTVLMAKKTGKFIIPALTIANKKTAPIALVVAEEQVEANNQPDIYLTAELSSEEVYVQQQVTLSVKLHLGVNIERGSLSEPTLEDANISQLDKDIEIEEIINGRRYQIIERKYVITPQKSGEYTLQPPIFSGDIAIQSQRGGFFRSFDTKPVNARSKAINLNVKPKPLNAVTPWLPSELFIVNEEWQPKQKEFMTGVPITRTITITAAGLAKEQLPNITLQVPEHIKVYPDQPKLHSGINSGKVVSQAVMNFAIVAEKSGEYTLPEIKIPWWNTITDRQEYAVLPEKKITITVNPNQNAANASIISQPTREETTTQAPSTEIVTVYQTSWLQWLYLGLWLLTSAAWFFTWYISKKSKPVKIQTYHSQPYENIITACNNNDGQTVIKNLLPWLQIALAKQAHIKNLSQALEILNDSELDTELNNLQASYYSETPQKWQGNKLKIIIQKINKSCAQQAQSINIELNP